MPEMPYLAAMSPCSSVFSLPTLSRPAKSVAILSMVGARARHGPHHGAQKSTSTGLSLLTTSCSQFSVVSSTTLALAIGPTFRARVQLGSPRGGRRCHYKGRGGSRVHPLRRARRRGVTERWAARRQPAGTHRRADAAPLFSPHTGRRSGP